MTTDACEYANEHPQITARLETLEREVDRLRDSAKEQGSEWSSFLVAFGELKARVEGLNGKIAGYLVAGSILSGTLALVAQYLFGHLATKQ